MEQKYKISEIKTYLQGLSPLRFLGLDKEGLPEKNPVDFIKRFFYYNDHYSTSYAGNGKTQTTAGKRRSIGDVYRVVSFYFPKVRLTTVYKTLLLMIGEASALSSICMATGLRVYRGAKKGEKTFFNGQKIDEFTVDFKQFEEIANCKAENGYWGDTYDEKNINFVNVK